jgi:hypothetical protein
MNFSNILNNIATVDPEVFEKTSQRRQILKGFGSKVAVAAIPLALGTLLQKAYARDTNTTDIIGVLNFALTLEYLESGFYALGTSASGLIPANDKPAFAIINTHEAEHVGFLKTTITALGGTPVTSPSFDYTAKGLFADVFTNYATFLAVSQTLEDTGVRAYKGQAGNLQSNSTVLTAALQIHSVEARHASHIRNIRMLLGVAVKPWIEGTANGGPAAVQANYGPGITPANYPGEDNTTQAGVNIIGINGQAIVTPAAASAAFDEPLDQATVMTLITPFIK